MSNPNRQMNTRRLPPLPGGAGSNYKRGQSPQTSKPTITSPTSSYPRSGALIGPGPISPKIPNGKLGLQDMMVTGHPLVGGFNNRHRFSPGSTDPHISSYDLNPDIVTTYLHDNPDFLEKYVTSHVNQDQIEKWLTRKSSQHKNRIKQELTAGDDESPRTIKESISRWKFTLHQDRRTLLQEMTRDIHQQHNRAQVLSELAACIAAAINAEMFNLYLVDDNGEEIFYHKPNSNGVKSLSACVRRIGPGSNLAAFVAHNKAPFRIQQFAVNENYPEGLGVGSESVHTVLCQPVLQATGDVAGIIELYRNSGSVAFTEEEEEIASSFVVWGSVAVHYAEMYHSMTRQRKLNEFLLTVTKSIFQDIISMDTVIMKIMNYAQKLVNADRASLFMVDHQSHELYARIFDIGNGLGTEPLDKQHREIRFPMDKGVAGHVASSGEILNIPDAYADERFNRDVDQQTGYKTKTILCMPIYIRGSIIGVVQMVNKLNGVFTKADEQSFETFAIYCGLALHHAKLYEKIRRSEQKYRVALEVLSYHSQATDDEVDVLKEKGIPEQIPALTQYDYSPWGVTNDEKPLYVIYMFKDLYNMSRSDLTDQESRFEMMNLYRFTLTVRKNYRHVPYHNWEHAFSVAHAMYTILRTTDHVFTPLECISLFVACLCHDLDHRGKTNSFMVKSSAPLAAMYSTSTMEHHHFNQTVAILQCLSLFVSCLCHDVDHRGYTNAFMKESASPLAAIYSTSTMEHHHFNHTITILQNEGHNIFKNLSSEEYKQVLGDIKHCILATDLALFFGNRAKLKNLMEKKQFVWGNKEHRHMLMAACMTASDLCSMYKSWDLQVQLVQVIMEEFWLQGDEEKSQGNVPIPMMDRDKADQLPNSQGDEERRSGLTPIPMMDRHRQDELPKLEVGFLVGICLPCYELMAQVLPKSQPMMEGAKANLNKWQELADKQTDREETKENTTKPDP